MDLDLQLELEGWKVKAGLVALALLVVLTPLALIVKSNRDRAEDWHRRAVVAEESVTGLRMVIVARSRELQPPDAPSQSARRPGAVERSRATAVEGQRGRALSTPA